MTTTTEPPAPPIRIAASMSVCSACPVIIREGQKIIKRPGRGRAHENCDAAARGYREPKNPRTGTR